MTSVDVQGETMLVEGTVTPDFASEPDGEVLSLYQIRDGGSGQLYLLDREGLKEYDVVRWDDGGHARSSNTGTEGANGSPVDWFALYAAPQDDSSMMLLVGDENWPMLEIPIP